MDGELVTTRPHDNISDMTLREHFAVLLMAAVMDDDRLGSKDDKAIYAVDCADALIAALNEVKK